MEDDCDETENSKSIKLKISKISLKRSMSEEWSLNETKKMRRDSSDEISSRASSSGFSSIHENNERKRFRSEKTIKDGCEYQSDQTFVNQGNMYNSMASEMHDMKMDNYLDIKIYCKDGAMHANSFLTGLAFFELRGIGELVGRDLIIPDIRVKELKKKLKNVLVSIGLLKCKEPEELIKTPELVTTSPELVTTSPELLTTSPELVTLSAECNSEYVPVEDEKTGGLAGFLPTDEASPKNTRVFISSKDGVIERKEKEQVLEIETPTKETPTKKTSEVKAHLKPTCKKCNIRRSGLMDFFHHFPCNDVKENTCIICKKTVESEKFKGHLKWNKKCHGKLKQKYKEKFYVPEHSKIKISKKVIVYHCKKCEFDFQGKAAFIHHKCLCPDPKKCKYCDRPFADNRKAKHFSAYKKCDGLLKAEILDKDSIKSISTITYPRPNYKGSDTEKSMLTPKKRAKLTISSYESKEKLEEKELTKETPVSNSQKPDNTNYQFTPKNDRVIKKKNSKLICKKCKKGFRGKAGFIHHKCLCSDPSKCKYCDKPFENRTKKAKHFHRSSVCKIKLKEERVDKKSLSRTKYTSTTTSSNKTVSASTQLNPNKAKRIFLCKYCHLSFTGKAAFIHHECLCNDPARCKFCRVEFIDHRKSIHFHNTRICLDKLQEENIDEHTATYGHFPKPKHLTCDCCRSSFTGYVSYYQHECKFAGPKTKCRICSELFGDYKMLSHHFSKAKGRGCKVEYLEMIKRDFPGVINESSNSTNDIIKHDKSNTEFDNKKSLVSPVPFNGKFPKSKGLTCNDCENKFDGFVTFYQHECKFKGPKDKCRFCGGFYEDQTKFTKHFNYRQNCKSGFIELIKTDFPKANADEEIDHNKSIEGINDTESIASPMSHIGKLPKPKGLICIDCGIKFVGYVAYYQHQCKFNGPKGKCRYCKQVYDDQKKFTKHLHYRPICRNEFLEMIKNDFPEEINEGNDDTVNITAIPEVENIQEKSIEKDLPQYEKFPKPDGLICQDCGNSFAGYIPYYKHECKFNEHKGKCWFCEESFEDEKKFGKHLYKALKCRNELIKRIERDFSEAFDKEKDDTNNVTAIPNKENEPVLIKDNVQTNEKFPKPKCLICNDCGIKFIGYVTYYQHQCKLNGPQGKCRFCEHVYEDHKKFAKHLTYRLTCRSNFIEMIKRDFPDAVNEIVDSAVLTKVQEEHAKYAIKAKLNSFTLALPKKDKSIPQDLIDESKAFLEKLIDAEHVSNNKRATFKQKSKQKIKIEAEEYYELRIPSPLPGTQHIIEMDNGEEDLEPEENDRYSYQHFGIENGVGEVGMDDVRSIENEGNVCEDIDDSLLEEDAAEESMEELGTIAGEERNNTEDHVQDEVTEEGIFDDELVDGEERMDADGIIGREKSIYTEDGRIAREESLNTEDMVEKEAIEESMNEDRIKAGNESLNAEDLFEEEAAEVDEDGKVDEEVSIDTEDIIEEKAAEGSMAEGGKDEIINSEEDKGTDKVVSKWEEFLKELEENNRQIILKDNDVALDKEKKSSSDETTELLKEGKELEDGDDCMKSGVVEIKNGYVDIENETEESFEEEDIEIADAEVDELEDGEMVTVEYQDCCISSTNDREKLREFLAENQITAHNISFKDMDYTKSKHTAFFKVSQEDMRKIQKENIRPEKDCIIHILNISTDLQR